MADVQAAKRYAQAVYQIATSTPGATLDKWRSDLRDVAEVLTDSAAAPVMADNKIAASQRAALLDRMLDVSPLALNLAKVLVTKGRSLDARAVSQAFDRMADEHDGIAHATVVTAVQLDDSQVKAIEQQLSKSLGKTVRAVGTVDPSIVGGLVVRVGDQIVDGSVRTRLERLRRELQGAR